MKKYLTQISILLPYVPNNDTEVKDNFNKALEDLKQIPVSVIAEDPESAITKAEEEYTKLLYTIPWVNSDDKVNVLKVILKSSEEISS